MSLFKRGLLVSVPVYEYCLVTHAKKLSNYNELCQLKSLLVIKKDSLKHKFSDWPVFFEIWHFLYDSTTNKYRNQISGVKSGLMKTLNITFK